MDVFISGFVLILVQDLLIIGMLIYIYFRIADLKTKILFSIFLLSSFLWSNMSLLTRFPDLSDSKRLLFAMFTFSSSFVFINSMVYFVFHVGGILKKEFKNPIFIFLQTLSLLFAALSFTQLTFKDVKYGFPVLNISFGPVYYAAMVMYLFYAVYFFSVLVSAYRRSSEILLKIQLRYILYAIGSSAAVMLFINGVLAKWIEGAPYFSIGHFSIAILFIVSAYILIRGKYLVLDYQYQILRNQFALKNEDHLKTLQKLFQTVQKELDSDHEVQTDRIASSLWKIRSFSDLPADDCSVSEEPLYEEMIQKNLFPENSVGLLSEKNAIPDTDYFQVSEYEDLIRANRSYLSHFFSVPFVCFSKEFYNLLIQTVHVSYFQLPVLFCGETGTYRKDLARAMHYFRRAENLKEISCAAVSPYELSQNIRKFLDEPETGRPGLLISDMDRLGRKGIEIIESLLLNPPKNK
ncbi:MAG: hypothetical protein OEZ34_16930, partial [Spirochaetia bacterium]|nr:hypothetical protein [Spirochaetia bacterium]